MATMKKDPKNAVIRARCPDVLKQQIEEIAKMQKLDPSDIIRIACDTYVARVQTVLRGQIATA